MTRQALNDSGALVRDPVGICETIAQGSGSVTNGLNVSMHLDANAHDFVVTDFAATTSTEMPIYLSGGTGLDLWRTTLDANQTHDRLTVTGAVQLIRGSSAGAHRMGIHIEAVQRNGEWDVTMWAVAGSARVEAAGRCDDCTIVVGMWGGSAGDHAWITKGWKRP